MIDFNIKEHYKIYIFFLFILKPTTPYQIFTLENDQLCSSATKQKITLGVHSTSGLIISLANASTLSQHTVDLKNDFICEFQIDTLELNNGLFAVIQNLVLRSDDDTNECIDYIEYRRNNTSISRRYCEAINNDYSSNDILNLSPTLNSFVEPSGVLDVYIYISKRRLRPYRKLELQLVFTSYRYCFRNSSQEDRPCSAKYTTHCIYKNFFNDGYVNCPYPGCVDETKCLRKVHTVDTISYGFKVAISSVIAMMLIASVVGIYLCRKLNKLCWSENVNNYQQPHVVEINEPTAEQPNSYSIVPPKPPDDESLPPSYNSLFPDK